MDFDFDKVGWADFEPYLNCRGAPLEGRRRANIESRRRLMQELVSRRGTIFTLPYFHTSTVPQFHASTLLQFRTSIFPHFHSSIVPYFHSSAFQHFHSSTIPHAAPFLHVKCDLCSTETGIFGAEASFYSALFQFPSRVWPAGGLTTETMIIRFIAWQTSRMLRPTIHEAAPRGDGQWGDEETSALPKDLPPSVLDITFQWMYTKEISI
jgi:hypothetical protein